MYILIQLLMQKKMNLKNLKTKTLRILLFLIQIGNLFKSVNQDAIQNGGSMILWVEVI